MPELIIIDRNILEEMKEKIEDLSEKLEKLHLRYNTSGKELVLDNQGACEILNITPRTLTDYRQRGKLAFSQIEGKFYYRPADIDRFIRSGYIRQKANRNVKP